MSLILFRQGTKEQQYAQQTFMKIIELARANRTKVNAESDKVTNNFSLHIRTHKK